MSKFYTIKYRLSNAWQKVKEFFNPRQKWLTKKIPNHWADKVYLIQELNFEMLRHFVEVEMVEVPIDWHYDEGHHNAYDKIMRAYHLITVEIPNAEKEMEEHLEENFSNKSFGVSKGEKNGIFYTEFQPVDQKEFEKSLERSVELEQRASKLIAEALHIIVDVREWLWT